MKVFTKISSILVVVMIMLSCIILPASAASEGATLYFSKNTVEVGDKITVTVSVNSKDAMYGVNFYLQYDDSVLEYQSGDGSNNAGAIIVAEAPTGQKSVKYSFKFKAIKVGSSTVAVTDCTYGIKDGSQAKEKSFTGASATMTVKDANLSDNANLKSLKISGYSISPKFSSTKTSYTAKVPYDVKKISITATPSSSKAKVKSVEGNTNLKVGTNTVTISVEAENGTQKQYKIKVTRLEENVNDEQKDDQENTSSDQITNETSALVTSVEGDSYIISEKVPEDIVFDGYKIGESSINGATVENAIDPDGNYCIYYLKEKGKEELIPFTYNADIDSFERLKYIKLGDNTYIFSAFPKDVVLPDSLRVYPSSHSFSDFSVECLAESNSELTDFKYFYCYFNGSYNIYRYDFKENTLQRYPDFSILAEEEISKNDTIFTRFSELTTNGKIIMIALFTVVLGILALLVMLIVYLVRRSINIRRDIILFSDDADDFDDVEVRK